HVTQDAHTSIDRHAQTHIAADDLLAIQGSDHLQVQGERRTQIDGQDSLTIGASQHLKAGTAIHVQAGQEIHLKAGSVLHIEAGMELSIQGGSSSLTLNPTGVFLTGPLINLNSGGGGASASPATPKAPQLPIKIGEKKAGKAASEAAARENADVDELTFQQLQKEPIKGNFADTKYLLAATGNAPLAAVAQNTLPGTQNAATSLAQNITAAAQGLANQAVDTVLSTVNQAQDAVTEEEPKVHVVAGMFFDGTGNNASNIRQYLLQQEQCLAAYNANLMDKKTCE